MGNMYVLCAIDGKPFKDSEPVKLTEDEVKKHNERDSEISGTFYKKCEFIYKILD